jgi:2-oxoisovalerate dehydrogenase E1 component
MVTDLLTSYRYMVVSREIDLIEQDFTARGEAFFHVSGAGHEASCVLQHFLTEQDWLHVHYRDKALMLARGIPTDQFFLSTFSKDGSHSRGRQMNAHMSQPDLNVLSLVGPVGNSALQAAGVAAEVKDRDGAPIVLCGLGDGTTQQGEVLEAIAHAVRAQLPVMFMIQDNAFAISTKTEGQTFYSTPDGEPEQFYGIPIRRVDGRYATESYRVFQEVVEEMRESRRPSIIVFNVDRLNNHTNADDQRVYRSQEEIERVRLSGDPIIHAKQYLQESGVDEGEIRRIEEEAREEVKESAYRAQRTQEPEPTFGAKKPLPARLTERENEYRGNPNSGAAPDDKPITMLEAIRNVLRYRLSRDERVTLFGEDIEDPKGDVFGITKGLTTAFSGRVINSPLAESSIIGISVGRALAGGRPVAFLQFADFLAIGYNQIFSELGSMYWRSDGAWQCPVIVMVTCGGYKPGLGPFHASSMEGIAAHTPGVDVFMPSTAGDAAGLLNAAFESERPTIFFYPKSCLNDRENATSPDVERQLVPIGTARRARGGDDITFVAYGNTVGLCMKAAAVLENEGIESDVIDLRSVVPWDMEMVQESAERTGRLVVVHEDNHTSGMGAEIIATVAERVPVRIDARRVTRGDTYVPFNFQNQLEVLPSYKRTLETAVEMLGGEIRWKLPESAQKGVFMVEAIGSSPSDESITVVEWHIEPGQTVRSGAVVADLEADKAAVELRSPVNGTVEEVLAQEGDMVKVGTPIIKVKTESNGQGDEDLKQVTREEPGTPIISGLDGLAGRQSASPQVAVSGAREVGSTVGIAAVTSAKGSRVVSNEEISQMCPSWTPADIVKRIGIESRYWLAEGETGVTIAVRAVKQLFENTGLGLNDIDAMICATETPLYNTPSMATLIQSELKPDMKGFHAQAHDVNAACTGYLYALQQAYDILQSNPDARVLVITAEALSPRLDTTDPGTAPIFGDAATASLIVGSGQQSAMRAKVFRPVLGANGENGDMLKVPSSIKEPIFMDGPKVFLEAVKDMMASLKDACAVAEIDLDRLSLIVPHQANQRIINAVRQRMKATKEQMYSNIRYNGNTSSSTIPLCLEEIFQDGNSGDFLGLTAFGGGITYGGGVLKLY